MKLILKKFFERIPKKIKYFLYRKLIRVPSALPAGLIFKIAETREELEAALALLHNSYVEVGLMKAHPSGLRVTPYHMLPSSTTLVGKVNDEVVATVTIIRDSQMGLPSDVFVDLDKLRQGGDRIAEISALAIKRGYRGQLLLHLMKFLYESCVKYLGINHLVATLTTDSGSHQLYEAILFFEPVQARVETNYAFSNFRPVIAEHLNLDLAFGKFEKFYSSVKKSSDLFQFFTKDVLTCNRFPERQYNQIDYPVLSESDFRYFFTERSNVLDKMNVEQLRAAQIIFKGHAEEEIITEALGKKNVISLNTFTKRNRYEVSLTAISKFDDQLQSIRILNISREGLKISSEKKIKGSSVDLIIKGPDGISQKIHAEKSWENGHGVYGLKIVKSNPVWQEMIDYFEGPKAKIKAS